MNSPLRNPNTSTRFARIRAKRDLLHIAQREYWAAMRSETSTVDERANALDELAKAALELGDAEEP